MRARRRPPRGDRYTEPVIRIALDRSWPEVIHALRGDPAFRMSFAEHLVAPVNTFRSLGGDAVLIAPSQTGRYPHLAAFLRTAPADQVDALFQAIGEAIARWSGPRPPWVSTAGMGVPWLLARLDTRPKYFRHAPYRAP